MAVQRFEGVQVLAGKESGAKQLAQNTTMRWGQRNKSVHSFNMYSLKFTDFHLLMQGLSQKNSVRLTVYGRLKKFKKTGRFIFECSESSYIAPINRRDIPPKDK